MKVKGVIAKPYEALVIKTEFEDSLDELYRIMGCECLNIVSGRINGVDVNIISDDNAMRVSPCYVSAVDRDYEPVLLGNLIIVGKSDSNGNLTSLSDEECLNVCDSTRYGTVEGNHLVKLLVNVE